MKKKPKIPNPVKILMALLSKDCVSKAILTQNDYLRAENKLLCSQIKRAKLTDTQRMTLAKLGIKIRKFSKELFESSINIVKPDTLLKWHRELVAQKFDGSANRKPYQLKRITREIEAEIVRIALEDEAAGYDKIVGYLQDLGVCFSKTTIAKILRKHGIDPAPTRKKENTWSKFIKAHLDMIWGCDFFTQEVWTKGGLVTYYILVFIHFGSRKLEIVNIHAGNPTQEWTVWQLKNFFYDMDTNPEKLHMKYLIHDKGSQFSDFFKDTVKSQPNEDNIRLKPICSLYPQMNSHTERVIQSIQNECTNRLLFFGERSLRYALKQYQKHYNIERHHQGLANRVPFPDSDLPKPDTGQVQCKTRLGGLLRQYYRETA